MADISYISFLNHSGYGQAARDYILSISRHTDHNLFLKPIGALPSLPGVSANQFAELKPFINRKSPDSAITVLHCTPSISRRFQKRCNRKIGFATFETYEPPQDWIRSLNDNDAVIAPSKFNFDTFAYAGVNKPMFHIPHSIDTVVFNHNVEPLTKYDRFTFLFFGAWKLRKGYEGLIESWMLNFAKSKDVQLIIKTDKPSKAEKYIEISCKTFGHLRRDIAPITVDKKVYDEFGLARLLKSVDCLIAPSLGEGFGLPGLQSLAVGTPVITTKFSGVLDYASDETCYMLEPNNFVLKSCLDDIPQFRKHKWAIVSTTRISEAMNFVRNNILEMQQRTEVARQLIQNKFRYEIVAKQFNEMLQSIYG